MLEGILPGPLNLPRERCTVMHESTLGGFHPRTEAEGEISIPKSKNQEKNITRLSAMQKLVKHNSEREKVYSV